MSDDGDARARRNKYKRDYYQRNRDRFAGYNAKWYRKNRQQRIDHANAWREANPGFRSSVVGSPERIRANVVTNLLNNAQNRSRKNGWKCGIDRGWIQDRVDAGRCQLTGIPFRYDPGSPYRPSVDRIDSAKPYEPGNCRMVLVFINWAKHAYAEDVFQEVLLSVAEALRKPGSGV